MGVAELMHIGAGKPSGISPQLLTALLGGAGDDATGPSSRKQSLGEAITAACYSKPALHIVTLSESRNGSFRIDERRSRSFSFDERSPEATRTLRREVSTFLSARRIGKLVLRTSETSGRYVMSPLAFKVEAMLELELAYPLLLAKSTSIASWVRKLDAELPDPCLQGVSRSWLEGQARAIETAAYAQCGGKLFIGERQVD